MKKRKIMSRVLAVVILAALSVTIVGCSNSANDTASNGKAKKVTNVKIGFSLPTLKSSYFVALSKIIPQLAKKEGWTVIETNANDDETTQDSDVEDLIAKGITTLLIDPRDSKAAVQTSIKATDAGVDVFAIDSVIDTGGKYVSEITSDSQGDGYLVGEWVAKQMGKKTIKIGMLSGNAGNDIGLLRREGLIDGITEYQLQTYNKTNFQIVSQGWGSWDTPDGLNAAEDMLQTAPDMNVLLTENDAMGLGAMKAFADAGRKDILIAAAADGQKEAYQAIMAGTYGATGMNDPNTVCQMTIQQIKEYYQGQIVTQNALTPAVCISKDNVSKYYNASSIF